MAREWWEEFFSGLWLDVQRQARTKEQTQQESNFIEKVLKLKPKAKVLDVPCGEGRISLELGSHGYRVTGVDIALPLLDDARRRADELGLDIEWEHRDMRDLPWQEEFDGAFCWWGSFGYFDEEGNVRFAEAVSRCLKPGSRFLLEVEVAETLLPKFQARGWHMRGGTFILEDRSYDHERSLLETEWTLIQEGVTEEKRSSMRIYSYRELCELLAGAGFGNCDGYANMELEPFEFGSKRLYLVAAR